MAVDRRTVLQNAQLFASKGQYDAAIAEWRKLTTDTPNDGTVFNSIGDLQLKRNATAEAVAAFLQAASAFRSEGSVLKAIAAYKKILKVDPARIEIYRHLGDLNAERGLLSSAVQDYLTLGKHYFKDGRNKDALEIYRKIVSQDPSNLDAQLRVAELCVQEGLVDEAVRMYLQLGREQSAAQQYEQAKAMYTAVLRLDPENAEAKEITSMIETGGSVTPSAARPAKPATTAAKSGDANDLMAEATRRIEEGQYAGAEAMLTQLLSREPGNPEICQLLARMHLLQGNLVVALGEYRFLAGAALRAQDYGMAESLIADYLKVEPASVPMLELLGELYQEKGDAATAAQHYGRAVEILLEHPEPGMPTLPAELFEKVQALAPGSAIARKLAPAFDPNAGSMPEPEPVAPVLEVMPAPTPEPEMEPEPAPVVMAPEPVAEAPFRLVDHSAPPVEAAVVRPPVVEPVADPVVVKVAPSPVTPSAPVVETAPVVSAILPSPPPPVAEPMLPVEEPVDAETRYALGMAYKDMGLCEEAKEEFLLSMKDSGFFVDSCLMMALCCKEQGRPDHAIQLLEKLISDSRCRGGNAQLVRYELALLYEMTGARDRALTMYQSIPSFHDVPRRVEALRLQATNGAAHTELPASAPSSPLPIAGH
ncbi:MAG TPA: tetratricopeptide repeat protein [Nitrospira sp.]|nr:tetratricopeptide repeat protein [Nitrospira sp.]